MKALPILQLEDDENDVLLFRLAMEQAGVPNPIYRVSDGQEAIDYLSGEGEYWDREQYPLPALALLDIKTPRRNGLEVLEWIRATPAHRCLVTVMLTASANQSDVDAAYRNGANAFLVKPSGFDELLDLAKVLQSFWLQLNRFPSPQASR